MVGGVGGGKLLELYLGWLLGCDDDGVVVGIVVRSVTKCQLIKLYASIYNSSYFF